MICGGLFIFYNMWGFECDVGYIGFKICVYICYIIRMV